MVAFGELTIRQKRVAALVAAGYGDKQIAARLGISCQRVRVIVTEIRSRLDLSPELNIRVQITRAVLAA